MKRNILLALCLLAFTFSYAQTTTTVETYDTTKSIQFYFGLGGAHNDYQNLNGALKGADLPTVGKYALSSIFEFDLRHNNFLVGVTGNLNFSPKKSDTYNTSLMAFYGGVNVGYYIVNSNKFHLAPQVGFGLYSSMAKITQHTGFDNFNQVLESGNSIDINQNIPALDFALKFDFTDFTKSKTTLTGVRLGYKLGLDKRGWGIDETSNSTVDNSPEDRINQFYAMVTIGFALQKPVKNGR